VPVGILTGQRSFGESLRYRPELGVRIAVVDRASGEARWLSADPFMLFHVANAWEEGDDVVVDVCAFPDASIMRTIEDVMGGDTPEPARAYLERLRIPHAGSVRRSRLSKIALEFPRVADRVLSKEHTRVYGVSWADDADFIARPAVIDVGTGEEQVAPLGLAEYAGECVPVTKHGASSKKDVWLLTLVLDGASSTTELRVLDGADLAAPPVATARLPHAVPFGFHGNFVAS
jgi:all-trans-8'-apo-beta-carotenal 15,15'-oxygenase